MRLGRKGGMCGDTLVEILLERDRGHRHNHRRRRNQGYKLGLGTCCRAHLGIHSRIMELLVVAEVDH